MEKYIKTMNDKLKVTSAEEFSIKKLFTNDKVKICAIDEEHLSTIKKWFNDMNFLRYFDNVTAIPFNYEDIKNYIGIGEQHHNEIILGIFSKENEDIIGLIGFENIRWSSGTSSIFIGIGDSSYLNLGLGKEAMCLALDYGFRELNLHKIQLTVIEYNHSAIKLYERVGFVKEGCLREYVLRDGIRFDLLQYGILNSEWFNKSCKM